MRWLIFLALGAMLATSTSAAAASGCDRLLRLLGHQIADASCVDSADLTTNNPATTPPDNPPSLPVGAFTPTTDRAVISPSAPNRTPITKAVPGVQLDARISDDPTGEARILFRLPNPDRWNGKLVIAGASGTRSEFNGDFAWSDYVLQQGYAYVSQNKGVLNLKLTTASDPLGCRLNPSSAIFVHFYDNDQGQPFTRWTEFMNEAARIGKDAIAGYYGRFPRRTYAVGTSNGGYQVRRALETAPELYDGGVDWEGTYVDAVAPNILSALPPAILNYPDYAASGFALSSTAAKNILLTGYPPDLMSGATSLWGLYWAQFWEVTLCQWQKRLDPSYDTYGSGTSTYSYVDRLSASDVDADVAAIATTGNIGKPLITVAGTMDALLPINLHARAYARAVTAALSEDSDEGDRERRRRPAYRLYEVQNGNHIETYKDAPPPAAAFPQQLELIQPHAQKAFDLLVNYVERDIELPPDQCIPRGGEIAAAPTQPGHCAQLFAP
jgi:3HB-oligomer hydrolase (3HBOH)/Tannase and feruloyl esterase